MERELIESHTVGVACERKHDGPVKQINQWLRKAFLNLCLVDAKLVVPKHVDAGNLDYIALLCAVSVNFRLVKTLQLLAMKIRSNTIFNDTRFYTKRVV